MRKRGGSLRKGRTRSQGAEESSHSSGTPSTEKDFKTLRYRLSDPKEKLQLARLTKRMQDLLILDGPRPGEAAKVLMEMVLSMDIITTEALIMYRNRKREQR